MLYVSIRFFWNRLLPAKLLADLRIVGWRVSSSMHTDFVLDALEQALYARQPELWCITAIEDPSTSPFAIRNALPKLGLSLP